MGRTVEGGGTLRYPRQACQGGSWPPPAGDDAEDRSRIGRVPVQCTWGRSPSARPTWNGWGVSGRDR